MAIRPTDIQGAIWQAVQTAPLTQRAIEGPREAQAAAQAAFAAHIHEREETIEESGETLGNRVNPDGERDARSGADHQDAQPRNAFEAAVDDAAGLDEPHHLIDFSA